MKVTYFNNSTKRYTQLQSVKRTALKLATYTGYAIMAVLTYLALVVITV